MVDTVPLLPVMVAEEYEEVMSETVTSSRGLESGGSEVLRALYAMFSGGGLNDVLGERARGGRGPFGYKWDLWPALA